MENSANAEVDLRLQAVVAHGNVVHRWVPAMGCDGRVDIRSPSVAVEEEGDVCVQHCAHPHQAQELVQVVHAQHTDTQLPSSNGANGAKEQTSYLRCAHNDAA